MDEDPLCAASFGCIVFYNTDESDAGMIRAS